MFQTIILLPKALIMWFGLCLCGFVLYQLYTCLTVRTKIIKLKFIIKGVTILDSDLNAYCVLSNHILGCSNLHDKIFEAKINSYYKIKVYGFATPPFAIR